MHGYADISQDDEVVGKVYDIKLILRFLKYLKPYKAVTALAFLFVFIAIGLDLIGPLIIKTAVDGPIAQGNVSSLLFYVILFLGSILLLGIFTFLNTYVTNFIGQKIILDIRTELFSHLQKLPVSFYDKNPIGRLVVRVTNDIESLSDLFTSCLVALLSDIFILVGVLIVMLSLNWKLTLITLAAAPFMFLATLFLTKIGRVRYRDLRKKIARVNANLNENITGMRTIQIFNREKKNFEKFEGFNRELKDAGIKAGIIDVTFWPLVGLFTAISQALLLWCSGISILDKTLTFGSFLAFWYYVQKLLDPILDLGEKYNILQSSMASSERIFKLLDIPTEDITSISPQTMAKPIKGDMEFQNVTFSYDGTRNVLEDISFKVKSGESLAIVGLTGAGKTTLIHLISRLYEAKSGKIFIDGIDIRDYDLNYLRCNIGLIPQDVFLFSGSVEENIRLGESSIPFEKIEEVSKYVNAHRFITKLHNGYKSDVKERGISLSSGERQLLSFARALAFDPKIVILDEATSNVDSETEALIQDALTKLLKGRTSIIIAHRLSTIQNASKVIVLHNGRLCEEGTHSELLKKQGIYYKLYELQYKLEI